MESSHHSTTQKLSTTTYENHSQGLDFECKQLDDAIKARQSFDNMALIFQNIEYHFRKTAKQSDHEHVIAEYKKMVSYVEKHTLQYLYSYYNDVHPISLFNINVITTLENILIQVSFELRNQFLVDERFIAITEVEQALFQKRFNAHIYVMQTIATHFTQAQRTQLLLAYQLINAHEEMEKETEVIIEGLLNQKYNTSRVFHLLENTPRITPQARYELNKTNASSFYLYAAFEKKRGNITQSDEYEKKYQAFLREFDAEKKLDCLQSSLTFGYQEMSAFFDQYVATTSFKKPSKKKKKKKQNEPKIETQATIELESIVDDNTQKPLENHESESQKILNQLLEKAQSLKDDDEKIRGLIHDMTQLTGSFLGNQSDELATRFSEAFKQIHATFLTLFTNETQNFEDFKHTIYLLHILLEIGLQCLNMGRENIDSELKNINHSPHLPLYFFQPPLFNQPKTPLACAKQFNKKLLQGLIQGIEIYSHVHLFFAQSRMNRAAVYTQDELNTIHTHFQLALKFNSQIYPELNHQQSKQSLFYRIEKLAYSVLYFQIRLENMKENFSEVELLEQKASIFSRKNCDLIQQDSDFLLVNSSPPIPKNRYAQKQKTASETLEEAALETLRNSFNQELQIFKMSLEELLNANQDQLRKQLLQKMELALKACFDIKRLDFTLQQFDAMKAFVTQFSFWSLRSFFNQPVTYINEKSVNLLCGLYEMFIDTSYDFVNQIDKKLHLIGLSNAEDMHQIRSFTNFKTLILNTLIRCVIFVSRTHLLLCQELMGLSDILPPKGKVQKAQFYLKKSNDIAGYFFQSYKDKIEISHFYKYQFFVLEEINTMIRAKMEKCYGNTKGALSLENTAQRQAQERKVKFPHEVETDPFLTPSYGYQEIIDYYEWMTLEQEKLKQSETQLEAKPLVPSKNKKPKKKKEVVQALVPTPVTQALETIESLPENQTQASQDFASSAPAFIKETARLPIFFSSNFGLNQIFKQFEDIINQSPLKGQFLLFGGAIFKENPADFDFIILGIDSQGKMRQVNELIDYFIRLGAKTKGFDTERQEYGYHDNGRHTICMTWAGVKIDITLLKTYPDELDFTVYSLLYDLEKQVVIQLGDYDGWKDFDEKQLNTIGDPIVVFTADPSRILRGIRLIATENFVFSIPCKNALEILFNENCNLFKTHILMTVLIRHVKRLFAPEQNVRLSPGKPPALYTNMHELNAMKALHELKLLPKLIEVFAKSDNPISQIYLTKLQTYHTDFTESGNRNSPQIQVYSPAFFAFNAQGQENQNPMHPEMFIPIKSNQSFN